MKKLRENNKKNVFIVLEMTKKNGRFYDCSSYLNHKDAVKHYNASLKNQELITYLLISELK
jgi:hypothetical protein